MTAEALAIETNIVGIPTQTTKEEIVRGVDMNTTVAEEHIHPNMGEETIMKNMNQGLDHQLTQDIKSIRKTTTNTEGETENSKPSSLQSSVKDITRVRHHVLSLKNPGNERYFCSARPAVMVSPQSDQSDLWSVEEEPPVSHLLSPADIARILPEQFDLAVSVASVPQRVPHHLTFR